MDNQSLEKSIEILTSALKEAAEGRLNAGDLSNLTYLNFLSEKGKDNYGKGLIFSGHGTTKQFVLSQNPDRFFVSENLDLGKEKSISINRVKILDSTELGSSVVKSSLRELGRLKGLIVDGSVSINQCIYFNSASDRLGVGTDEPHSKLSIVDQGIEIILGVSEKNKATIGTFASHDLDISTGNTTRITVKSNGDVDLGNFNSNPSKVRIHGKLSIGVSVPDSEVDLHVAGPVRIHNKLHMYAENPPVAGNFSIGDIIWNSNPRAGGNVGWVCTRAGSPGVWNRFGDIR